jgi:hypothetical protein
MNQPVSVDDREGFAAFLLRLRGRGSAPKPLIAAFEATPRRGVASKAAISAFGTTPRPRRRSRKAAKPSRSSSGKFMQKPCSCQNLNQTEPWSVDRGFHAR